MNANQCTVLGALELEVQDLRGEFAKLEAKEGRDSAVAQFEMEYTLASLFGLEEQNPGEELALSRSIKMLAMAVFRLELVTGNVMTYHER